jgi:hypothetical protein
MPLLQATCTTGNDWHPLKDQAKDSKSFGILQRVRRTFLPTVYLSMKRPFFAVSRLQQRERIFINSGKLGSPLDLIKGVRS